MPSALENPRSRRVEIGERRCIDNRCVGADGLMIMFALLDENILNGVVDKTQTKLLVEVYYVATVTDTADASEVLAIPPCARTRVVNRNALLQLT